MIAAWMSWSVAVGAPQSEVSSTSQPIEVDGVLDEAAWEQATPITEFTKFQPVDGGPPAGRTEVRFLQDDTALYVGVRTVDAGYPIRARVSPRERINADDQVGIYIDTFLDERSGYIFYLNPLGIQQDIRHNSGNWNANWDTAFKSRGRVVDDGYEIEIAFPWRSLKFPGGVESQTWGILLTRKIPGEGAKYGYPTTERNHPRLFSQEALLTGVRPPSRGSGVELIPSLTAAQNWSEADNGSGPDFTSVSPVGQLIRPSLDARIGITPDVGLAGTLNPDFSQVEADIADVRLNARFAFQFPERRPFFLDGIDLYQDTQNTLYTRSIANPLYGVKVSGREGPLSIGVVHALDRDPLPSFNENPTPGFADEDVEDRWAQNTLARVRVDAFGTGAVGIVAADKRIVGTATSPGRAGIHDVGGVDAVVPMRDRWLASGSMLQSYTTNGDDGGTGWGMSSIASLRRSSGIGTGVGLEVRDSTEGFRQETGFNTQSGLTLANSYVDHTVTPTGLIDTWMPVAWGFAVSERGERDRYSQLGHRQHWVVGGVHSATLSGSIDQRREQHATVNGWQASARYAGQVGRWLEFAPRVSASRSLDFGLLMPASTQNAGLDVTVRPTAGIRLDGTLQGTRHTPLGAQTELAQFARGRVTWQFTRSLGLRVVGQHAGTTESEGRDRELLLSTLLTWLEVPGTAAYLGFNERIDLLRGETIERTAFAKVSVLVRP